MAKLDMEEKSKIKAMLDLGFDDSLLPKKDVKEKIDESKQMSP